MSKQKQQCTPKIVDLPRQLEELKAEQSDEVTGGIITRGRDLNGRDLNGRDLNGISMNGISMNGVR